MPRPTLPPTPVSSTDLPGKDDRASSPLEPSFTLPPPAIVEAPMSPPLAGSANANANAKRALTRSRPSAARFTTAVKEEFALPPPPTRSRKIIQMNPPSRPLPADDSASSASSSAAASRAGGRPAPTGETTTTPTTTATGKRKQPSATSVAGRKIARKTAHSLIERRRRSKMNEEFGVLKQMIPACRDQEMHKLAILQASIEYLRYLERCISDLEANARTGAPSGHGPPGGPPASSSYERAPASVEVYDMDDAPSSAAPRPREGGMTPSASPYSFSTTPVFPPSSTLSSVGSVHSPLTSPATRPQRGEDRDLDHEATEALLLLNSDRRGSGGRGMSVKDLLAG